MNLKKALKQLFMASFAEALYKATKSGRDLFFFHECRFFNSLRTVRELMKYGSFD